MRKGFAQEIPEAVYERARHYYETTERSVKDIAGELCINMSALQSKARRFGWLRPRLPSNNAQQIAKLTLARRIESQVSKTADELTNRATQFRKRAIETSEKFLNTLERLNEQIANGRTIDAETLQRAIAAHKQLTDAAYKQFGIDERQTATVSVQLCCEIAPIDTPQRTIDVESVTETPENGKPETEPLNTNELTPVLHATG